MLLVAVACLLLISLTTLLHYEVLRGMNGWLPALRIPNRSKLLAVMFAAFAAHILEIGLYGAAVFALIRYAGLGSLTGGDGATLMNCIYFSNRPDSPSGRHRGAQRAAADWLVSVFCLHCHGAFLARRFERKLEPEPGFMAPWPRPPQARASNPGKSSMRSNRWAAPAWRKAAPCSGSGQ